MRPTPRAWRKGQDMTVPVRTPCRVRGECSIEGCERPRHARGWCSHHWRRWHRHGDPLASRCPRYTVDELWRLNAYLDSLAGERTKLGDAELLAMSLSRSTAAISSKLYELRTARRDGVKLPKRGPARDKIYTQTAASVCSERRAVLRPCRSG